MVCIHLAKVKEISPKFFFLRKYTKRAYDTDKYKATVNNKITNFDKEWASLKNLWEK